MDDSNQGRGRFYALWIVVIGIAVAAAFFWGLNRHQGQGVKQPATTTQTTSREWTDESDNGVKVNLPKTPMTNVPPEQPSTEASPKAATK